MTEYAKTAEETGTGPKRPHVSNADKSLLKLLALYPPPVLASANLTAIAELQKAGDVPLTTLLAPLSHAFGFLFERFVEPKLNELVSNPETRRDPETRLAVYYAGFLSLLADHYGDAAKASGVALETAAANEGKDGAALLAEWLPRIKELSRIVVESARDAAAEARARESAGKPS